MMEKATNFVPAKTYLASYNQWQNIMGILKRGFKIPSLPLYNVANP